MLDVVGLAWVDLFMQDLSGRSLFSVHTTFPPFGFLRRLLMGLFCNESSVLMQCAQNPWNFQGFRCIFQYFRCIMRKIPGKFQG